MAFYYEIPDDIKKLFPPSTEDDVHFTNNRYTLSMAFDWEETNERYLFWDLVNRKLFDQARSLLNNPNMINKNFRKPYEFWMNNLPINFVIKFRKRLNFSSNSWPMNDNSRNLNFEELIDLILWEEQPEGSLFWNDIGDFKFENIKELNDYLENVVMKQIIPYKKIKLIW